MTDTTALISRLFLASSLLLLLQSCAPTGGLDSSRPVDPQTVMTRVDGQSAALSGLTGYGKISIDTPEMSNTGSISIKVIKPDSLSLEISGPFGVTVARGLVTKRDFRFYNGLENTVLEGETNATNLRRVLRLSIEFSDIIDVVTGTMTFRQRPEGSVPEGRYEDNDYHLVFRGEDETCEYWVDSKYVSVRRFLRRNDEGTITEEINFKEFREKNGVFVPQVISISRPLLEESLVLVYENISVNDFPIQMAISIPSSARRIRLSRQN